MHPDRKKVLESPYYHLEGFKISLWREIKRTVDERGISQAELCKILAVSKGYVSRIMGSDINYTLKSMFIICMKLNIVPIFYCKSLEQVLIDDEEKRLEIEQQIRLDAQKEGRSFSGQIRWMLESYYKNKQLELERELDKPWAK